ncbi:uncharacterized protein LOC142104324 isoform X2 [Mixophyes fleayi]|uniref:uncharacterized protein LOC142104324 isoform X2 n=1 Tax=Mixophyes fleayi TaxID=3061075 RepID=UPI003F4DF0EE
MTSYNVTWNGNTELYTDVGGSNETRMIDRGQRNNNTNGTLRDVEKELALLKRTMEASITSLDLLVAQVYKYSKRPVQAQAPTAMTGRGLSQLLEEFQSKMEELETAVKANFIDEPTTTQLIDEPPDPFRPVELYYLIQHVENDNWIHLMRVLNMNNKEMETCRNMSSDVREQKYQMLLFWLSKAQDGIRNCKNELIFALEVIDYRYLADFFRQGCTRSAPQLR